MQRDLPIIIGVLAFVLVVAVVVFAHGGSNNLSLAQNNTLPTALVLGATDIPASQPTEYPTFTPTTIIPSVTFSPTTNPTPILTPTPRITTKTTPPPTPAITCTSPDVLKNSNLLALKFMNAHKAKDAYQVFQLISPPLSDTDQSQYNFWLGTDNNNVVRLYQTPATEYTTVSFTLGQLRIDDQNHGQNKEIYGTKGCIMMVTETRTPPSSDTTPSVTPIPTSVVRYLDFSLAEDGTLILTAFQDSVNGTKYSGFN